MRSYLRDIGRVPLLTHEQEITLSRQVQDLMELEELEREIEAHDGSKPSKDLLAKESGSSAMKSSASYSTVAAKSGWLPPTGLVVSVAKKYTKRNMEPWI